MSGIREMASVANMLVNNNGVYECNPATHRDRQRRHRREKRLKLRGHLAKAAKAAPAERQAIQAKLDKTYAVVGAQSPEKQAARKADKADL